MKAVEKMQHLISASAMITDAISSLTYAANSCIEAGQTALVLELHDAKLALTEICNLAQCHAEDAAHG